MSRTLYLHIGHTKTGSSFLQSSFLLNRKALRRAGILYPRAVDERKARRGLPSSGNGAEFRLSLNSWSTLLAQCIKLWRLGRSDVLLSNEGLLFALSDPKQVDKLDKLARWAGFRRIKILLFIRDPDEHLLSLWGQAVKRGGETRSISDFIPSYRTLHRVNWFLAAVTPKRRIELHVKNYSRVRGTIVAEAESWLGLASKTLEKSPPGEVNRSFSMEELSVQAALNRRLGASGRFYANRLMRTPFAPDGTAPSLRSIDKEALISEIEEPMRIINAALPSEARYDFRQPTVQGSFDMSEASFSVEQQKALAEALELASKHGRIPAER